MVRSQEHDAERAVTGPGVTVGRSPQADVRVWMVGAAVWMVVFPMGLMVIDAARPRGRAVEDDCAVAPRRVRRRPVGVATSSWSAASSPSRARGIRARIARRNRSRGAASATCLSILRSSRS